MAEPPAKQPSLHDKLSLNIAVAELPHPFKKPNSQLGITAKDAMKLAPPNSSTVFLEDAQLSEDAKFVISLSDLIYMGVADGVGSWREYGVDPRLFSHSLMAECRNILKKSEGMPPSTTELLQQAYDRVKANNVIGSSTACVAMFDGHNLHFSNLGDSGIVQLRHIDSEIAGALKRDRVLKREERTSDLRVTFVSQQQLVSFNHPYQLGWTGELANDSKSFKCATDACTTSIHVRHGDILILASDGLFDNVEIPDICQMALEWERDSGLLQNHSGTSDISLLANRLCRVARDHSLNNQIDSPFAILAKENDIMWSGGMPDDCTVIAMHVVAVKK